MSFTDAFVVVVLVAIILMYVKRHYGEVDFVRSRVDGREYLVRRLPDATEAADMLARANQRLARLVQHMVAKFPDDPAVKRLYDNYDPEALSEGGMEAGYTSYSVNKGEKIVLCLRQRDNSFVDPNVLTYVAVHELGHLMSATVGHNDEFWANFKRVLEEAMAIGIYKKVDFAAQPHSYCGISITSSVV